MNFQIEGTSIINKGMYTGGVAGKRGNAITAGGYVNNVKVEGSSYVGGVIGNYRYRKCLLHKC